MEKIKAFIVEHKVKLMIAGLIVVGGIVLFLAGFVQGCQCAS